MTKSLLGGRAALAGVLATVCAIGACDSVLDIEDPKARPDMSDAGAAGDTSKPSSSAGSSNVDRTPSDGGSGGDAGSSDAPPITLGGAGSGGEGGEPPQGECTPKAARCTDKAPEICDETGHWVHNTKEAEGDCSVLCDAGKCVECQAPAKRCAACADDDASCNTNQPQSCVDGVWKNDGTSCKNYCDAGSCVTPPSCNSGGVVAPACGNDETSCCASPLVSGGTFFRDYDGTDEYPDKIFAAQVSPFHLDKFEVTVQRMRPFVLAFEQLHLKAGQGKSPHIASDEGWSTDFELPKSATELLGQLKCEGATWSDDPLANNDLPVNCVSFAVAYAFCVWDGGRLPTATEWNFAAAGGDEQRAFPWPAPTSGPPVTSDYAVYSTFDEILVGPANVGSKPMGAGRWGQADMAGNLAEWTLDFVGEYPDPCKDCLNVTANQERTVRGGDYALRATSLRVSLPSTMDPAAVSPEVGFRCARDQP